jgi:antitoxin component YwqK of YwqJK toxin-antitoxin module
MWIGLVLAAMPIFVLAQSKKDIREAGIKTITIYKSDYKTGVEKKVKESETTYNSNGSEAEVIEYDDLGKITKHEKYTYNANNDKETITEYDANGKVKKVTKYSYNTNNDKAAEIECDASGNIKKSAKYIYSGKFKTEKDVYDSSNKLTSKKTYVYGK